METVYSDWCLHQESNPDLPLRTGLFYPLNYGGEDAAVLGTRCLVLGAWNWVSSVCNPDSGSRVAITEYQVASNESLSSNAS